MSLAPGTRLGPYEITASIGAGGMGEVYRARDTRLGRDVAIKILPDHLTNDPERVARFEREAQALAALNHPNIAQIYGIEGSTQVAPLDAARGAVSDSRTALVMEYVPGRTLDEQIRSSPVDVPEAVRIAHAIALALEAAHSAGIIHRDLKPANVKIRDDGVVKVLDFGLAKAAGNSDTGTAAATRTSPAMTQQGVILGTAAYMAPEQARGRAVDKRADIWAFGCVFYEMLTGRATFGGDTVTDVLAAVVTRDPDWDALPAGTPPALRSLLKKCLRKDPKLRLHDISDARIDLESPEPEVAPASGPTASSRRGSKPFVMAAVMAALIVGGGAGIAWRMSREIPPVEWTATRLGGPDVAFAPRLSPDGHMLVAIGKIDGLTQVVMMKPGTGSWTVLTRDRTRGLVNALNWSPDSSQIYYDRITDAPNGVYTIPNLGGDERLVVENADSPLPLTDGSLLFGRINADRVWQLHRFWPSNGRIEALPFVTLNMRTTAYGFERQIDANHIAIVGRPLGDTSGTDRLYVFDLTSNTAVQIGPDIDMESASDMAMDPTDGSVLLSLRENNIFRLRRFRPDAVGSGTSMMTFVSQADVDVAADGSLFVALNDRPHEALQFDLDGGNMQILAAGLTLTGYDLPIGDAVLMTSRVGGKSRVTMKVPGHEPVNLVKTDEDTRAPFAAAGADRVVVTMGDKRELAVVARDTGRVITRFAVPEGVTSVGASPDGATIYFSAGGKVSSIPASGGAAREIGNGDSLVVDPDSGDVIVKLDEVGTFRLARLAPQGGPATPIPIHSTGLRLIPEPLTPGAIRRGKLLLPVATVDSWNWFPAVLDLKTGALTRVPLKYDTDFHSLTWSADGRLVGAGLGLQGALWKFERVR
ncbi:MAG TPA: protein kinase [Vicinamibacterales bacterium]|nr:protein kinase [Vicinamibacterales bacterium]